MKYEIPFTAKDLQPLRDALSPLSEKRRNHVLEVEKMAVRIGAVYLPGEDGELLLRAAALLHDVTKEYSVEKHVNLLSRYGIVPGEIELAAPKTLHAISAAACIPDHFPRFALPEIVSAVRWHTTGHADMTLPEKIIYLADYIDESRQFPECVRLRKLFWGPDPAAMSPEARGLHLTRVLVESFDITVRGLLDDGLPVHPATNEARNALVQSLRGQG